MQARSDCEILFLPAPQVREICRAVPGLWECFVELMCGNFELMADAVEMLREETPHRRVTAALHLHHSRQSKPDEPLHLTQADLASITGVSLRSVAAALSELEASGVVTRGYGNVRVLDVEHS
jgi:CRP-like cAMP-binding protein